MTTLAVRTRRDMAMPDGNADSRPSEVLPAEMRRLAFAYRTVATVVLGAAGVGIAGYTTGDTDLLLAGGSVAAAVGAVTVALEVHARWVARRSDAVVVEWRELPKNALTCGDADRGALEW
jgi:hypothetical protein